MSTTVDRIALDDSMIEVKTTTTIKPRYVDWDDIEVQVEYDDCGENPWDTQCGYEHELIDLRDHRLSWTADILEMQGYVNGQLVKVDRDHILEVWGEGEGSKQQKAEYQARCIAQATRQLVKWHYHGWEWYSVTASYDGYCDSIHGIDCYIHAGELGDECRHEVAAQLEANGYVVTNKPEPVETDKVATARDRIRRQLMGNYRYA